MKSITRTIPTSKIQASVVAYVNGKVDSKDLEPITIAGEVVTKEKAMKLVQKTYGKENTYFIKAVETSNNVYEISLEDFFKNAKKIEAKAEVQE